MSTKRRLCSVSSRNENPSSPDGAAMRNAARTHIAEKLLHNLAISVDYYPEDARRHHHMKEQ